MEFVKSGMANLRPTNLFFVARERSGKMYAGEKAHGLLTAQLIFFGTEMYRN